MKKFFIKSFILFIIVVLLIWSITLSLPIPQYAYNFSIIDKHRILANTESPKIVLAGGSNIAFGIDSGAIQNSLQIPVVNMGIHAGFGLGRILDDISPFLQTGDILLIIPEYEHFVTYWNGGNEAYQLIFDFCQYRLLWSPHYGLPNGFSIYLSEHPKPSLNILSLFEENNDPEASNLEPYTRAGFNKYGDYVKHLELENKEIEIAATMGIYNKTYLKHFFYSIDAFARRGITVALSYPGFEEQSFRNSAALIQELDAAFRTNENLRVLSTPEAYCLPAGYFYDTAYHLNAPGRTVRTEQLIKDLKASGLFTEAESY
jgi:hypothetical protein